MFGKSAVGHSSLTVSSRSELLLLQKVLDWDLSTLTDESEAVDSLAEL